jgi:hypothetical protein
MFGPAVGLTVPDESILRANAQEAIRAGKLPTRLPDRIWTGPGIGKTCPICDGPITTNQLEFEIQYARDGSNPELDRYHVHVVCFSAWEFERTKDGTEPS